MSIRIPRNTTMLAIAIAGALALAGCDDHQPANLDQAAAAGTPSATATANTTSAPLLITNWGPRSTLAGKAFNLQPDGNSALWAIVNQSLSGKTVAVELNGKPLPNVAVSNGNAVSVEVPANLYAEKGNFNLRITATRDGHTQQSDDVTLQVQ